MNKNIVRSIDMAGAKADIPSVPASMGGGVAAPGRAGPAAQRLPALQSMAA